MDQQPELIEPPAPEKIASRLEILHMRYRTAIHERDAILNSIESAEK